MLMTMAVHDGAGHRPDGGGSAVGPGDGRWSTGRTGAKIPHGRVPLWGGVAIYLAMVLGLLAAIANGRRPQAIRWAAWRQP